MTDSLKRGAIVRLVLNAEANRTGEGVYKNQRRWVLIQPESKGRWLAAYASSDHEDTLSDFGLPGVSLDRENAKSLGFTDQVSIYPSILRQIQVEDIIAPALGQFQRGDVQMLLLALDLGLGLGLGRGGEDTIFPSSIRGMVARDPNKPASAYVVLGPHKMIKSETIPRPMHLMVRVEATSNLDSRGLSALNGLLSSDSGTVYLSKQNGVNTVKLIDDDLAVRLLKDNPPDRLTLESIGKLDQIISETFGLAQSLLLNSYPVSQRSSQEWNERGMKLLSQVNKNGLLVGKPPINTRGHKPSR